MNSKTKRSRRGSALLIVVAFLAMFTILILGFLARAAIDYQVSDNSTNLSGGDFFSQGAIDCIVGDLKQEIVDGSTSPSSNVYIPKANVNMDPAFSGINPSIPGGLETDGLNNVLKVSSYGAPFYNGASINRASNITTTTPSLDNRSITLASWNKPLLMPPTSPTDLTPTAVGFTTPDWIYVARDGTNPGCSGNNASFGLIGNTVNNSSPANSAYVDGRYSYVIYNEGGLLDVNAAGSPDVSSMTIAQNQIWTRKGPSAFADLTQLPGMTQSIADSIVGWRNLASAGPTANFPTYTFAGTPITNFLNYQIGETTNWMTTGNSALTTSGQSDRMFTSRQQLINYLTQTVGAPQQALQCLGTFSRVLNEPSYAPASNRPTVTGAVASGANGPYSGGNSGYQLDNVFNPIFRTVKVTTSFTRTDGSIATVGEPLVKKRFALSRLCWLTYKGPSATLLLGDPLLSQYLSDGVSQTLLNEGTAANIYKYFGLTWTAGPGMGGIGGYWLYNHGITVTTAGTTQTVIGSMSDSGSPSVPKDIVSADREPDFFELLKAAVNVGSIAKTKTDYAYGTSYAGVIESSATFQIFQLGANIITQSNPSQYPIWIKFNYGDAGGYLRSFYGSTDLPYFYSDMKIAYVNTPATVTPGPWPPVNVSAPPSSTGQTITNVGKVAAMMIPTIWNPYDASGPGGPALPVSPSLAPSNLRITVVPAALTDPSNTLGATTPPATDSQWNIYPKCVDSSGTQLYQGSTIVSGWLTEDSTALTFSNVNSLYRQPTALMQQNIPAGSNLSLGPSNVLLSTSGATAAGFSEMGSNTNFIGFFMGVSPQVWNSGGLLYCLDQFIPAHPNSGATIRLEYQAGTQWIPYQEIYINLDNFGLALPIVEAGTTSNPSLLLPFNAGLWVGKTSSPTFAGYGGPTNWNWWGSYAFDPRSSRWGDALIHPGPNFLTATSPTVNSQRPTGATLSSPQVYGGSSLSSGWIDNPNFFPSSNMGGPSQNLNNPNQTHYIDPDGIVRRASGGLVNSPTPASTVGLPMATPPSISSIPILLHRPYRSVTELGYVFSDTPWRNIDFFTPESGYSALLDVFCINEDYRQDALAAGKVDLNTRQEPVLQALLAGAYRDESAVALGTGDAPLAGGSSGEAATVAKLLLARTAPNNTGSGKGPLTNIADLVGHYVSGFNNTNGAPYDGFSADLFGQYAGGATSGNNLIQRFMEATPRALSDAGQVGTWNLLIDVVAQSGRCSVNATTLANFLVKGERHYWVHVAIDRQTGAIIDESIEPVNL